MQTLGFGHISFITRRSEICSIALGQGPEPMQAPWQAHEPRHGEGSFEAC